MKKYLIMHGDFANVYDVRHVDRAEEIPEGWEQITRAEAIKKCVQERARRRFDASSSGYAPAEVLPLGFSGDPYRLILTGGGYIRE